MAFPESPVFLYVATRPRRKKTSLAGLPVSVVLHFRPMQISDPQHLGQLRQTCGHIRGGNPVRCFPLRHRLIHIALIGLDLRQRIVFLNHVEWLDLGQALGIGKEPVQSFDCLRQRLLTSLAGSAQVLAPIRGLGKFLKQHFREYLPGNVRRELYSALAGQVKIPVVAQVVAHAGRLSHILRGCFLLFRKHFQDQVPRRDLDHACDLPRLQSMQRFSRLRTQAAGVNQTDPAAAARARID